ncbi:hypothetical protein AVEN_94960-1 [Araneus ventricosus]|uniref:25S rRNA (uridine-N(3))-methyltransferase BMT5-like domain-containing protein n=1 Tax=Araneus ventricosus TaxID=182803 RepID=A0A4Y2DJX9_ARAVE|nr:hypothetical protein AVEN_94960-1 [Araneus ventricosus]
MKHYTLFVGEGNFSFSASYIQNLEHSKCHEQVIATALISRCLNSEEKSNIQFIEDHGGTVHTNVDATKLEHHPIISRYLFSKIYFYFPHVPKKMNIKENRKLVENFFISNTTVTTPDKLFIDVPRNYVIRKKWCKAMKRDPKLNPELSASSIRHVCRDHFDVSY